VASNTLTITAWGIDKASGPLNQVAAAAKKMPEGFSKAQAAMGALGGAAGELGGPIAGVASKLAGLAGTVATGGPLGLGIAALTVAVSAGVTWWEAYTAASKAAEEISRNLETTMRKQSGALTNLGSEVDKARRSLDAFGKTAETARADELRQSINDNIDTVNRYSAHLDKLRNDIAGMADAEKADIIIKRDAIRMAEAQIADLLDQNSKSRELIGLLEQTTAKQEAQTAAEKRAAAAKRAKADAERESNKELEAAKRNEEAYAKKVGERLSANFRDYSEAYARKADLQEQDYKAQEAEMERLRDRAAGIGDQFGTVIGASLLQMAQGTMTAEEGFKNMAKQVALLAIKLAIAAAAAAAINAATGGAGAGAGGFVGGVAKGIFGFSKGGMVTGGSPGRDSVPAMLTPGELVLPVDVTRRLLSSTGNNTNSRLGVAHFASGGVVTGRTSGSVVISAPVNLMFPPTRLQKKQMARHVGKTWAKMVKAGQIPPFTED